MMYYETFPRALINPFAELYERFTIYRNVFTAGGIALLMLPLLPSYVTLQITIRLLFDYYKYKAANTGLIVILYLLAYFANIILIATFLIWSLTNLIDYTFIALTSVGLLVLYGLINTVRFSQIRSSIPSVFAQIDSEIRRHIERETNIDLRRVKVEALVTTKHYFELLTKKEVSSIYFAQATIGVAFLLKKLEVAEIDKSKRVAKALETELDQLMTLLAKSVTGS